jgi:hypothetical protein
MVEPVYTPPAPKKSARGVTTPRTRMANRLVPIPRVYDRETDKVKKVVKKKLKRKPVQVVGRVLADDQYNPTMTFSPAYGPDAGRTYGAMIPITPGADSPEGNKEFYVRLAIEQHRVDPQLQGFKTAWEPPPGWVAVDGLPVAGLDDDGLVVSGWIYDEAISNPVSITRVFRSPAAPSTEIGFLAHIGKYKP